MNKPIKTPQQRDQQYLDLYAYALTMTVICMVLFVTLFGVVTRSKAFTEPLGNLNESGVVCSRKTMW